MRKPDPELLPIQRPRCPTCQIRMFSLGIVDGPEGYETRIFECLKCRHSEAKQYACDPLQTSVVGWLSGELGKTS